MFRFVLIFLFFLLPGCGELRCIKPESASSLREKLDIISTKQKWIDSSIYISDRVKVTEIDILPSRINFCPNQYVDFLVTNDISTDLVLPFDLKKGDSISFSVVENKVCRNNESGDERYIKFAEKCSEKETEYFAKILNKAECDEDGCPNKYIVGNTEWLNGREYWSSDFSKSDQDESRGEIEDVINSIKDVGCSKLSESDKSKIDTSILNYMCGGVCLGSNSQDCIQVESHSQSEELTEVLKDTYSLLNGFSDSDKYEGIFSVVEQFTEAKGDEVKPYIPSLEIRMDGEDFEYLQGGTLTNYNYEMKNDHPKGERLTFSFNSRGKGGYNVRVMKSQNRVDNLYIHVSDTFPGHNPGENQISDIPVDISKVYDSQYMESLKDDLKSKTGTIYYGIRDHGCGYDNEGEFSINLTIKEAPKKTFSIIYNFFDEKVKRAFFGSSYNDLNVIHSDTSPVKIIYQSFVASNRTNTIRSTIIALLILFIVLYTLYYFLGLSRVSIYEFLIVCVKIGIIATLLQDGSWNFFYNNAFSIFINTPKHLIEIANFRGTTSNVFEFLDLPLNRFLSSNSLMLIISLIFSGYLGIAAFCLVIWGLITVCLSIFNALFSFITSIALVALLLCLAPIFITCLLFSHTRQMFHIWVSHLARFSIHPVVLLIFISLISQAMDYIVYSVFDFEVCSTCILRIKLKIFEPCIIYGYASKYSPNITAMMAFVILGHAMKALVKASSNISDSLFGTYVQDEPGRNYQQTLLGIVGLDQDSRDIRGGGGGQQSAGQSKGPQIPVQRPGPGSAPRGPVG